MLPSNNNDCDFVIENVFAHNLKVTQEMGDIFQMSFSKSAD